MRKYFLLLISYFLFAASAAFAADLETYEKWGTHNKNGVQVRFNLGYAVGGTTPLPLPAEMREINRFSPYGGGNLGVECSKMFGTGKKRWGIAAGAHGFVHGMMTGARVKGYKMAIEQDGNSMAGYFTGMNETNVRLWGMTLPLKAVWRASSRWTIEAGPYLQFFLSKEFEGNVHDGYLRVNDPTGEKIAMGSDNPATFDFSKDMRDANWGVAINFDWKATRHFSLYGNLDWGFSPVFRSDFQTIAFPMYSIYANVGVAYSLF